MPTKPSDMTTSDTISGLGAQLSGAAAQVKEKTIDLGHAAAEKLDDQRDTAASGLETAASAIRARADQWPGGETVSGLAHSAANKLTSTADYVRQNDVKAVWGNLEQIAKKNPGPSLLAAACVGFLVGRALSRNS